MAIQTDSRAFLGTGSGLSRDWVSRKWTGPIAAAVNLPQGCVAGALIADANAAPVIYPFLGDGTMRALGFVSGGFDNTAGLLAARQVDVLSMTGRLPDKNAGGGNAILQTDIYKPAYGPDNGSCSKLAADGPCIGMLLGLDDVTGEPIVLVDPVIAAMLAGGGSIAPGIAGNVTGVKIAAYSAQFGDFVRANPTGGAFPVNLPIIAASNKGLVVVVKNVSSSLTAITVTPNGVQTIDGGASLVMNLAREAVTLTSDGTSDWMVS